MSHAEWQRELRRQVAGKVPLAVRNLGDRPVFSEQAVMNPRSGGTCCAVNPQAGVRDCPG